MRNKSPVAIKKIPNARLGFLVLLGFGLLMLAKMPNELSDPAHGTHGLQPERDGRVRGDALPCLF